MARLRWDFTLNVMDVALVILALISLGISISVIYHLKNVQTNQKEMAELLV